MKNNLNDKYNNLYEIQQPSKPEDRQANNTIIYDNIISGCTGKDDESYMKYDFTD